MAAPVPRPSAARTSVDEPVRKPTNDFEDLEHSWAPSGGVRDTSYANYADLKEDAEKRKREREARAALEAREAEIERRERALRNKEDEKHKLEAYRHKLTEEEAHKRKQKEKERLEKERAKNQPKRPPFNFEKEKPQILVSIANASQAAINLTNACKVGGIGQSAAVVQSFTMIVLQLVDRKKDRLQENLRVQDNLEKAKMARRPIIRYIQVRCVTLQGDLQQPAELSTWVFSACSGRGIRRYIVGGKRKDCRSHPTIRQGKLIGSQVACIAD